MGDKLLVNGYYEEGVTDSKQKDILLKWLEDGNCYSDNTPEYKDLLKVIKHKKKP